MHLKAELVSSLLAHLVSKKQDQIAEKSIELVPESNNNAYSCFVNLESGKLKRVISNLINNAAEAIDAKGVIRLAPGCCPEPTIRTKIAKLGIKAITKNFAPYIIICNLTVR